MRLYYYLILLSFIAKIFIHFNNFCCLNYCLFFPAHFFLTDSLNINYISLIYLVYSSYYLLQFFFSFSSLLSNLIIYFFWLFLVSCYMIVFVPMSSQSSLICGSRPTPMTPPTPVPTPPPPDPIIRCFSALPPSFNE